MPRRRAVVPAIAVLAAWLCVSAAVASAAPAFSTVQRGLERLVEAPGRPPRGDRDALPERTSDGAAGRPGERGAQGSAAGERSHADRQRRQGLQRRRRPQPRPRWELGLEDTIAQRLAGHAGRLGRGDRQAVAQPHQRPSRLHRSRKASREQSKNDPRGLVSPLGSHRLGPRRPARVCPRLALRVLEHRQHRRRPDHRSRHRPALRPGTEEDRLRAGAAAPDHLPDQAALPKPFIHGYLVAPGERPEDVSTALSPSGAWASGAIVSTPQDLNAFIRAYLGLKFFSHAQQRQQMGFVARRRIEPAGTGQELCRPGAFPLPDQMRRRFRPYRELPRLRAVGGRHRQRRARCNHLAQHPRAERQAPRPAARGADDRRLRPSRQVARGAPTVIDDCQGSHPSRDRRDQPRGRRDDRTARRLDPRSVILACTRDEFRSRARQTPAEWKPPLRSWGW